MAECQSARDGMSVTAYDGVGTGVYRTDVLDHEPAYTPPPPPGGGGGILPHGNFWVPWPSKYIVQVVCKWAVAVCVCGAGSNKCTIWNSKLRWPCLLATHLLWQKSHFHILFYCLNSLICCSFPFLFVLNVSLLLGTADAEILTSPLLKPQSWRMFSLKSTE